MKRSNYSGEDTFLVGHENIPEEHRELVEGLMQRASEAISPLAKQIASEAHEILPGLNNTVVILTDYLGRPATIVGTLTPREQLAALERAVELAKLVVSATDN